MTAEFTIIFGIFTCMVLIIMIMHLPLNRKPNKTTLKAMKDIETKKNLSKYKNATDLINKGK